jgi:hypothetical protein
MLSCSGAHGKSVTAMLPLSSEAPGGPDMLLTASADGTIAGERLAAVRGTQGRQAALQLTAACAGVVGWQALKPALPLVLLTHACWTSRLLPSSHGCSVGPLPLRRQGR